MTVSTEQIIADMNGWTNLKAYFEGVRGQIDADLAAATRRVGSTYRAYFIDQTAGDDTNDGSIDHPLKTLGEASARSVYGGHSDFILKSDYHMDMPVFLRCNVRLMSHVKGVKRQVTFADRIDDIRTDPPRFHFPQTVNALHMEDIVLVSTTMAPHVTLKHMIASHGLTIVTMILGEIIVPPGADLAVFQRAQGLGFSMQSVIYPPTIAGLWYENTAAGTDTATMPMIAFTNIRSL